ncbi:DUF983 domain-containing protein [Sulfitobacter sp. 915]|uniref:DUF983 domain-containing protein n=1 Tax=Sulfitobacter sp. 915 TaxID=3368558 RepID=UPI003744BD19
MTLATPEFIRRFLPHVLLKGPKSILEMSSITAWQLRQTRLSLGLREHRVLEFLVCGGFDDVQLVCHHDFCRLALDKKPDSAMKIDEERDTRKAIFRGLRMRCPSCGEGKILFGYLKVKDQCDCCGQELHHASVDDGPAYFTLMVVVAIIFPMFAVIYSLSEPEPFVVALLMMALATVLALLVLPRVKGMFIGLQWSKRLHGF